MNCDEARRHLLDAEPKALRGQGESPLALHVQSCAPCRAHAATILARTDELRASLDALVALGIGDEQVARALHAAQTVPRVKASPSRTRSIGRRIGPHVLVPLALAAALAALLPGGGELLRGLLPLPLADRRSDASDAVGLYVPQPEVPESPIVNAVGARGVAVMRTANPQITVVWTF